VEFKNNVLVLGLKKAYILDNQFFKIKKSEVIPLKSAIYLK